MVLVEEKGNFYEIWSRSSFSCLLILFLVGPLCMIVRVPYGKIFCLTPLNRPHTLSRRLLVNAGCVAEEDFDGNDDDEDDDGIFYVNKQHA